MRRRGIFCAFAALLPIKTGAQTVAKDPKTEELKVLARSLVPIVSAAQPELLAKYQKLHDQDVAAWAFRCERFGDYLTVYVGRLHRVYRDGNYVDEIDRSAISINLKEAPTIQPFNGHQPDLDGRDSFWPQQVNYEGKNEWETIPAFGGVNFGIDSSRKRNGYSLGSSSNGYQDRIDVWVDGLARAAEDDKIVFGAGGGTPWNDMIRSPGGFSYSPEQEAIWKRLRPGATLMTPAGLGDATFHQIMDCIGKGAM